MKRFFIFFVIFLFVCPGCSLLETKEEQTAEELLKEGTNYFDDKDYSFAIESFEKLKDWYPFSKHSIFAELKIADAYFKLKEYAEAILSYEEFESLHPGNEATPYVVYQIGLCYFMQIRSTDRGQTPAKKALSTFTRLKKQFPDSNYAQQSDIHIHESLKSLAGNELYIGLYYFKTKHYKAALNRFKAVISDYPDVGTHQEALQYISLCEELLKEQETEKKSAKEK